MNELNNEQKEAALYTDGPALVLAGPGTGKTHTIASRVVYLIEKGLARPGDIFVITFTNRAARELKERISSYLNEQAALPFVGTFHSLGLEIIRNKLQPPPELISGHEQAVLLKELGVKGRTDKLVSQFSYIKNTLIEPDDEIIDLFSSYNKYLKGHNLIDMDDLLLLSADILTDEPSSTGLHLIVDEYQDINPSAHRFVNAFLRGSRNIFAVGDPDQAIYSFRGSSIDIILSFERNYPGARVFNLKKSYRLTRNIIELSEEVIKPNTYRLEKETVAMKKEGKKAVLFLLPDPYMEADFIAGEIIRQVGGSAHYSLYKGETTEGERSFSDFAVLVRIKALMPVIEAKLQERGIPVRRATGAGLFDYPAVNDLIEHLDDIKSSATINGLSVVDIVKEVLDSTLELSQYERDVLLRIASSFNPLSIERAIACFTDELKMLSDTDLLSEKAEQVTLLTMHAAKGLEFPVVFIAGAEEGIVPYTKKDDCDIEEERRLLYVALTRAKEEVIITCAKKRTLYGKTEYNPPSRFLSVSEDLLEKLEIRARKENKPKQTRLF